MNHNQVKQAILSKFQSKFRKDDWRFPLYNDDQWGVGVITRKVTFRKQGVTLNKGDVVCVQRRADTESYVMILHTDLLCATSLEVKSVVPA